MPSATSDPPNPADAESLSAGGRRRVVYWDRSPMPTGSEWLPGLSLPNSQVIAVHRELLPHLEGITLAGNALGSAPRP